MTSSSLRPMPSSMAIRINCGATRLAAEARIRAAKAANASPLYERRYRRARRTALRPPAKLAWSAGDLSGVPLPRRSKSLLAVLLGRVLRTHVDDDPLV